MTLTWERVGGWGWGEPEGVGASGGCIKVDGPHRREGQGVGSTSNSWCTLCRTEGCVAMSLSIPPFSYLNLEPVRPSKIIASFIDNVGLYCPSSIHSIHPINTFYGDSWDGFMVNINQIKTFHEDSMGLLSPPINQYSLWSFHEIFFSCQCSPWGSQQPQSAIHNEQGDKVAIVHVTKPFYWNPI